MHAQADLLLAVKRVGPAQPLRAIGAHVFAEEQQDRRLIRLQHVEPGQHERGGQDQQHSGEQRQQTDRPDHQRYADADQHQPDRDPQIAAGAAVVDFVGAGHGWHHGLLSK